MFKATIVILFFMHVKYSTELSWTMTDCLTRGWHLKNGRVMRRV